MKYQVVANTGLVFSVHEDKPSAENALSNLLDKYPEFKPWVAVSEIQQPQVSKSLEV